MSLAVLNNALLVHEGGLALNCECCEEENPCPPEPCVEDDDCRVLGTNCICVDGTCVPGEEECPPFHELIDGRCVAPCDTFDCATDSDCDVGCICVNGKCEKEDLVFYCCEDSETGDRECTQGQCPTGTFVYGGPYTLMTDCCVTGCHCDYRCNTVSQACEPHPDGQYTSEQDCYTECDDGGGLGACCETLAPNSNSNNTDCAIRRPANNGDCEMYRSGCRSETPQGITRVWRPLNERSCDQCPSTEIGACCKPDGCCEVLCEGECEALGGNFYGRAWETCDKMRDHDGPTVGSPCDRDYNCQGCSVALRTSTSDGQMVAGVMHSYAQSYFSVSINDTNINDYIKDTFLDCVAGRKLELITYDFAESTNTQVNAGLNVCQVTTVRREKKSWMIHCEDGDVVDITSDALKDDVTETLNGVDIGTTLNFKFTRSVSTCDLTGHVLNVDQHDVIDSNAGDQIFTDNNTTAPSALPAFPDIENENLWDCP